MPDATSLWQMSLFRSHFKSSNNHLSTITADSSPAVTTNLESTYIKLKIPAKEKPKYSLFADMEPK